MRGFEHDNTGDYEKEAGLLPSPPGYAGVVAMGNPCRVLRRITEQDKMEPLIL